MEPPCEHGGVLKASSARYDESTLQWSRRVNTAECGELASRSRSYPASMEPPCEHGGVPRDDRVTQAAISGFNGAAV